VDFAHYRFRGISIHALSNTTLPNLIGPGEVQLVSDQDLALGNVSVAGVLGLSAGHDLTFAGLTTGANASLSAGNAIVGNSFIATGQAVVTANLGSLQIASITAADLTLTSLGDLNIPSIRIDGPVLISAPNIIAHITNGSSDGFSALMIGRNGNVVPAMNLMQAGLSGIILTDPWFGEPTDFGNPDQWIISLDGGLAVNTGGQP
jgi:hypothetical protein